MFKRSLLALALCLGLSLGANAQVARMLQVPVPPAHCGILDLYVGADNSFSFCVNGTVRTLESTPTGAAFNDIASGTNSTAAMVVGTGASLGTSGTGTITATGISSNPFSLNSAQTLFIPNQTDFTGTFIYGGGGSALSHSSGADGQFNTSLGATGFGFLTSGYSNSVGAYGSGYHLTTGFNNAFWGTNVGLAATSADDNDGFSGTGALQVCTTCNHNSAFGGNSLTNLLTGIQNVGIGFNSLQGLDGAQQNNTCVGFSSCFYYKGDGLTAIGFGAALNTTGVHITATGYLSQAANTSGTDNTSSGFGSSQNNQTGSNSTSMGAFALFSATSSGNTAFGSAAGNLFTTDDNMTLLGFAAEPGATTGLTNGTAIGYAAVVNASNQVQLGNTDVTSVNTSGAITAGGGSANTVVCWKTDGKTMGYATVAEITAGTCH